MKQYFQQNLIEGLENSKTLGLTEREATTIGRNPLVTGLALIIIIIICFCLFIFAIFIFQTLLKMFTGKTLSPYE